MGKVSVLHISSLATTEFSPGTHVLFSSINIVLLFVLNMY